MMTCRPIQFVTSGNTPGVRDAFVGGGYGDWTQREKQMRAAYKIPEGIDIVTRGGELDAVNVRHIQCGFGLPPQRDQVDKISHH